MDAMKAIYIDVDVHRAIEAHRLSFSESDNEILRRVLLAGGGDAVGERRRIARIGRGTGGSGGSDTSGGSDGLGSVASSHDSTEVEGLDDLAHSSGSATAGGTAQATATAPKRAAAAGGKGRKPASRKQSPEDDAASPGWRGVHRKSGLEIFLPNGTELRAYYDHKTIVGLIEKERIVVNGNVYKTLSPALYENVTTRAGTQTQLNGWNYWQAKRPGETRFSPLIAR